MFYQIGHRDQQIVEDTLAEESLYQTTIWRTIASTDVERFPDGHESDNRVEEERCNLRSDD